MKRKVYIREALETGYKGIDVVDKGLLQQALDILNEVKGLRLQYYDTIKSMYDQVVIILLDRNFDELRYPGTNGSINNFQVKIMKDIVGAYASTAMNDQRAHIDDSYSTDEKIVLRLAGTIGQQGRGNLNNIIYHRKKFLFRNKPLPDPDTSGYGNADGPGSLDYYNKLLKL